MSDEKKTKKDLIVELRGLRRQIKRGERGADYDPLTGLPGRIILYDRLSQALLHGGRRGRVVALMFLRIENLKMVNDTYGRSAGDVLIETCAERIGGCLRKSDTVGRPGRDEFIIMLPEISCPDDAMTIAEKLLKSLGDPVTVRDEDLFLNVNIGTSLFPGDGLDADTLLKNAYTALGSTGQTNTYSFYSSAMNAKARERISLENSLRSALKKGEFIHHFQPQVDLSTGRIRGMEALLRWKRPGKGVVMPKDFIEPAEEIGLIVQLGEWSLYAACLQQKRWEEAGIAPGRMAVNVSARQFQSHDMKQTVSRILSETGLPPEHLELELTENILFQSEQGLIESLVDLKRMGVKVSIDDFGTGYSSLSYIRQFPVKKLKIVRSFVNSISINPIDLAIAKLIIDLSHTLGIRVVAEGVE
ncbi:MAG: EAL domain-containing protein, partial [Nitrospirota bacterium]